jgi:hypothetical protein
MIITLLSFPLKVCNYKLGRIVPRRFSPLNRLVSHHLNLPILINHRTELHPLNSSLRDLLSFLRFPLLFPTQCTSAIGDSPWIYLGFPIGYSPPMTGFAQTIASGTVALDSPQKNPGFFRRLYRLLLRARKVSCREMRYRTTFLGYINQKS